MNILTFKEILALNIEEAKAYETMLFDYWVFESKHNDALTKYIRKRSSINKLYVWCLC